MLKTEKTLPPHQWIDKLDDKSAIELILNNQIESIKAINLSIDQIEIVINKIIKHINEHKSCRIIYVGAGTSGRLGILDCVELPPTFNWNVKQLDFLLAGGKEAMFKSSESSEDDESTISKEISEKKINKDDIVIGISASGTTKYTVAAIKKCGNLGALTIGISNNNNTPLIKFAQYSIFLNSSIEVVSGSTRLAAGTTQKICLNIISTMVMTRLGKVKNSLMVDMRPTNKKLQKRKKRILNTIKVNPYSE